MSRVQPTQWPDSVDELLDGLRVVTLPLNTRFRGVDEREVALVQGPCGFGEFAPFVEYGPTEAARWLDAAVEAAWTTWPDPVRTEVPVNATVPAVPAERVAQVLSRYDGCTTAKIKVAERGQVEQDDIDRVAAVRDLMGPDARIRVDANGGWSLTQAADMLARLAPFELEYAEQPCADVRDLAHLRIDLAHNGVDVPIAADESIRKAEDPFEVARLRAADVIVVKVAPLGGVAAALRIVDECGLPAVVSSAIDSSIGLRAGVALAAALPSLEHACGLGTGALLAADVTTAPLLPVGGVLPVREVVPDEELLVQHASPAHRERWWRERVRAAWAARG
ncbi:O-succinylbenzoate synthase [Janibacter sp. Soil728]|uniref:o-succinylbenzoate synthase n=1 Tax=Janibacter sp. Soil728 TaxID=1736393 RepID=UPI0006F64BAE|nr:o-succinylbenzoate synthase [Janibacter sp. Soil728]KRE35942.1 O-succinylbenzoate synthase [Janibacter sp. Soil728]